jgi:N-acetylmuramoyl-L-alanine amidase
MVVTNALAQADAPRPAELAFTHLGKISTPAWQIGSDCFVPVSSLRKLGWKAKQNKRDVTITSDTRSITIPYMLQSGQNAVNIGLAAKKFGAGGDWIPGSGVFQVYGFVRSASVRDGLLSIEATLALKPQISFLTDPPRVVLDFEGMRLDSKLKSNLVPNARVGQFQPNVVRIAIETDRRPSIPASQLKATRVFELNYELEPPAPTEGNELNLPISPPISTPPGSLQSNDFGSISGTAPVQVGTEPPQGATSVLAQVNVPEIVLEDEKQTVLKFRPNLPLMSSPQIRRVAPDTLELVLPGVQYIGELEPSLESDSIVAVRVAQGPASATFTIVCKRPMGAQISGDKSEIKLLLITPRVGDGKLSSKTIVVDAGHGGHDGGAQAPDRSAQEKNMTLAIALRLANELTQEGATVILTRSTDVFIPLKERPAIANRSTADFFVSIHINSSKSGRSLGGMTFYHMQDPISQLLGECIQSEISKVSKLQNLGVWSDSRLYDTGLAVLRYAEMPAVLIEMGFINQTSDRLRMLQPEFRDSVSKAIVSGLKSYLGDTNEKGR